MVKLMKSGQAISLILSVTPSNHHDVPALTSPINALLKYYWGITCHRICRECLPEGCQAAGWRKAVHEELVQGQVQVVRSLLTHPRAHLFTFKREELEQNHEAQDSTKGSHIQNPCNKEEIGKNEMTTETPPTPSGVKKNLFEEKTSPTLLFASGTFTKLLQSPSSPKRRDSFTGESILSFSSSLPSSLSTDPPPTPLSVSSYGSMNGSRLPLDQVDVKRLPPCQVNVRPLVLKSFPTNPIQKRSEEENESLESEESSTGTDSLDSDVVCDVDEVSQEEGIHVDEEEDLNPDFALELNELKSIVENRGCSSIFELHLNIEQILKTWPLPEGLGEEARQEVVKHHHQVMEEVFPWFDLQEPSRHWADWQPVPVDQDEAKRSVGPVTVGQKRKITVKRPNNEHTYAKRQSLPGEKYKYDEEEEDLNVEDEEDEEEEEDIRKCFFCGDVGNSDINMAGRLLSLR